MVASNPRWSIMEYLGNWLLFEGGRMRAKFRTRSQAERVLNYVTRGLAADDDPTWDRLAADMGVNLEAGQ